jgi:hypothetical protein
LIISGLEQLALGLSTKQVAANPTSCGTTSLNSFIGSALRRILLRHDLNIYGRITANKICNAKTPYSLVKVGFSIFMLSILIKISTNTQVYIGESRN